MADVPAAVEDRIEGERVPAHLATSVDDRPHVAPVWYRYENGTVELVTTGTKLANLRTNPRVALSIQRHDEGDPIWAVTLRGTATVVEDSDEFREANAAINRKYGAPEDAWSGNTLVRVDVGSASLVEY